VGADLVEALGDLEARELAAGQERLLDVGKVDASSRGSRRRPVGGRRRARSRCAASAGACSSCRRPGSAPLEPDVARVVRSRFSKTVMRPSFPIRGRRRRPPRSRSAGSCRRRGRKRPRPAGQRPDQRPAGAEELRSVEGVLDLDAPLRAVAVAARRSARPGSRRTGRGAEPRIPEQPDLVGEEGLAGHLDQELRDLLGDRLQAGGEGRRPGWRPGRRMASDGDLSI
jgi:hypothetical protein